MAGQWSQRFRLMGDLPIGLWSVLRICVVGLGSFFAMDDFLSSKQRGLRARMKKENKKSLPGSPKSMLLANSPKAHSQILTLKRLSLI